MIYKIVNQVLWVNDGNVDATDMLLIYQFVTTNLHSTRFRVICGGPHT